KHITQPPPPLAEAVPGLPTRLADAVERCLAKDPAQRFANAEALADVAGVALESRRTAPLPIRLFIKKASDMSQNLLWLTYFQLCFLATGVLFALTPEGLGRDVFLALGATFLAADPVLAAGVVAQIRALLKSGYTRDDLAAVWNRELQLDQDERAFEHGRTSGRLERASRWASALGWGVLVFAVLAGPGLAYGEVVGPTAFGTGIVGGLLSLWRYDGRTNLSRRLMGKFVNSRLGRWMFGLAGLGLDRSALASLATHRPTALAIGMAVDSLFAALPEAARLRLAELPSVVRNLEADAMKIRERMEQLNDVATKVGRRSAGDGVIVRREALDRDLLAARAAAQQRLADTVTALETIRLDLLRLTAGGGSVDSLTADLAAARAVREDVDRLLDARAEVEAHLSGRTTPSSIGDLATRQLPGPSAGGA
ncbi:MAG: hypothetical protein HY560_03050, partial [Gemmatimonadetes bacterium]|nr:hypothetical protein [Gemmatimonadota bacterium]